MRREKTCKDYFSIIQFSPLRVSALFCASAVGCDLPLCRLCSSRVRSPGEWFFETRCVILRRLLSPARRNFDLHPLEIKHLQR